MTKFITEILAEIDQDPAKIANYKNHGALRIMLEYAFDPAKKMLLPDGVPPYKEDAAPLGMSPGNFLMEIRRLYVLCRPDLTTLKRETIFIEMLESFHPSESKLLLAIKDQNVTALYPNVTHKLVYDAGFVSVPPVVEAQVEQPKKRTRKPKTQAGIIS